MSTSNALRVALLIVSLLTSFSLGARPVTDPKCGDILPIETSILTETKKAWDQSQADAGSGAIKLDLLELLTLDLGGKGESKKRNIGSEQYSFKQTQQILLTSDGKLAIACSIAACKLKQANAPDESIDRFVSYCFGYPPSEAIGKTVLLNPMLDLIVTKDSLGKPFPKLLTVKNGSDHTANLSAFTPQQNSELALSMTDKDQHQKIDPNSVMPLTVQIKAPTKLAAGRVTRSVYFLKVKDGPTLVGVVQVRHGLPGNCVDTDQIGKQAFCSKCMFKFPIERVPLGVAIPAGNPYLCPKMQPGRAVTATFSATIKQDDSFAKNDSRHQMEGSLWFEHGGSTTMPTPTDVMPQPAPMQGTIKSYVPTTVGAWGSPGTVAVIWNLTNCRWWRDSANQTAPGTCSAEEATIEIRTLP